MFVYIFEHTTQEEFQATTIHRLKNKSWPNASLFLLLNLSILRFTFLCNEFLQVPNVYI